MKTRYSIISILMFLMAMAVQGQVTITIGGNIYGGGNEGDVQGQTSVTIHDGTIIGNAAYNAALPGAVKEGDVKEPAVAEVKFTQEEITKARPGDAAYGKTTNDVKSVGKDVVLYTALSAAVYNSQLTGAKGGNVFAGARMANVNLQTEVTIRGGKVLNVYGGNDISGKIGEGITESSISATNINIFSSVVGDVYGGGNGSYAYRDLELTAARESSLRTALTAAGYSDIQQGFIISEQKDITYTISAGKTSLEALNAFRPNVTKTDIVIKGTKDKQVCINGSVYCGGNSATITTSAKLSIGSYVAARNIFLGCNGENMRSDAMLNSFADNDISSIDLTIPANMAKYMEAVEMDFAPLLVFSSDYKEEKEEGSDVDPRAHIGSFYCGGNVGSIYIPNKSNTVTFPKTVMIHEKLVGGCNNAFIAAEDGRNAEYRGGIINGKTSGGLIDTESKYSPKVKLELANMRLEPRRLTLDESTLQFTYDWFKTDGDGDPTTDDGMLRWGNIYGGCFNSGYVMGDVQIDIASEIAETETIFWQSNEEPNSGIHELFQSQDVFCKTLTVFGGGYGKDSYIEGNTTINIKEGSNVYQVFGGGEQGPVNGDTEINLLNGYCGEIYGGGFEGDVNGHTTVNLVNGEFYDAFGGACNADVRDYIEVYIGRGKEVDGTTHKPKLTGSPKGANVYGGNDFGGTVRGETMHSQNAYTFNATTKQKVAAAIESNSYVEYYHGKVDSIAGGNYGNYDYEYKYNTLIAPELVTLGLRPSGYKFQKPSVPTSFLNIVTPEKISTDKVGYFLGGSEGASGEADNDEMQTDSYVLVDAPGLMMPETNVYGGGAHAGLRGGTTQVWLLQGTLQNAFGASLNEGGTEHAHVYVPVDSKIHVNAIFAGADGALTPEYEERMLTRGANESWEDFGKRFRYARTKTTGHENDYDPNLYYVNMIPCDAKYVYVDFHSEDATVEDAIYGGNNFQRRTVFSEVNISVPVVNSSGELRTVFGAGLGEYTWVDCTKVNLLKGAKVQNVYGGGSNGKVLDDKSEREHMLVDYHYPDAYKNGDEVLDPDINWILQDWAQGTKYTDEDYTTYYQDNMPHSEAEWPANQFNTNVKIEYGAWVENNAFAGGMGSKASVSGKTGLWLNGGTVKNGIYGGGEEAFVADRYELGYLTDSEKSAMGPGYAGVDFSGIAQTNVFVQGGRAGYVYGGGLNGIVGCTERGANPRKKNYTTGANEPAYFNIDGITNVTIGTRDQDAATYGDDITYDTGDTDFDTYLTNNYPNLYDGLPEIRCSIYGGGEKGAIWGKANLTINNGQVGYEFLRPLTKTKDSSGHYTYTWDESVVDSIDVATLPERLPVGEPVYANDADGAPYIIGFYACNYKGIDGSILDENGNAFGAGYGEGATVDETHVEVWGGFVRNSLYGGGEIAAVGRGETEPVAGSSLHKLKNIELAGKTHIEMYNGHICRDLFGGGRGYSYDHTGNEIIGKERYTDGYVFGKTEVEIHGGEVGTTGGMARGFGNVFGGGNIGYVYSGDGKADKSQDTGSPSNYYYYKHDGNNWVTVNGDRQLTEDCKVVIEPYAQVMPTWKDLTKPANNDSDPDNDIIDPVPQQTDAVTGEKYVLEIDGHRYGVYDYVPIDDLNKLRGKNDVSNVSEAAPSSADENYAAELAAYLSRNHDDLMASDRAKWAMMSDAGILIRNGVFAGGNVAIGSDKIYANAVTVYGNVTATVRDVYRRDFITIGTEHVGGLYGDGNLSLVNGYRELHVANYGTDYYSLQQVIPLEEYQRLTDRERAYFRLRYKALKDIAAVEIEGVTFPSIPKGKEIYEDEYKDLPKQQQNYGDHMDNWKIDGFCSIYAGRLLNTLQRADFAGIFGSRLVLQGAQDRRADVVDYTRYTINRVGELSLNAQLSPISGVDEANQKHGNYFGIYNVVNHLGNLTSDVFFDHVRTVEQGNTTADGTTTYYQWKYDNRDKRSRNNGTCHNEVALASGVFLELTTERSTKEEKDYGLITGIVELDLINAKADEVGGGYVYAKNEHHGRSYYPDRPNVVLSAYNTTARTYKRYDYDGDLVEIQTSGNFIHDSRKTIVDDCYPNNAEYDPSDTEHYSKAHYWYVKGSIYVYDMYVSAYTGASQAYEKEVKIPLTITPGSHGNLKLINVQPNLYAYYSNTSRTAVIGEEGVKVNNGAQTYFLNDSIGYWDYSQLSDEEKNFFVPQTMKSVRAYKLTETSTVVYPAETVMLPDDYTTLLSSAHEATVPVLDEHGDPKKDEQGNVITKQEKQLWDVEKEEYVPAEDIIHMSNNMGHDTGYVLTLDMDSPTDWDDWYTKRNDGSRSKMTLAEYTEKVKDGTINENDYRAGPTYHPSTSKPFGQRLYDRGELIEKDVYDNYPSEYRGQENQADVTPAYAAKEVINYSFYDGDELVQGTINMNAAISESRYQYLTNYDPSTGTYGSGRVDHTLFERAQMCTETIQLNDEKYFYRGDVATTAEIDEMKTIYKAYYRSEYLEKYMRQQGLNPDDPDDVATAEAAKGTEATSAALESANEVFASSITLAYYCERAGLYGGQSYNANTNYEALESWCTLQSDDRGSFTFNGDAFDLLIDPEFKGRTASEDGKLVAYGSPYCDDKAVEYNAIYNKDTDATLPIPVALTHSNGTTETTTTVTKGDVLSREEYENKIPNEQYYFAPIRVTKTPDNLVAAEGETYYIVIKDFVRGDVPYVVGQTISATTYLSIDASERNTLVEPVQLLNTTSAEATDYITYFFCRKDFTLGEHGSGVSVTDKDGKSYNVGQKITKGTFLMEDEYKKLPNQQNDFIIKGREPTARTTLYVSRESEINDLSKGRIYTVIYQYTYNEGDDAGNVDLVNEMHIINVYIYFESGVPSIGPLSAPATVLPSSTVGLKQPSVSKGAYEILGGGWQIFDNQSDAVNHRNGVDYDNNATPMYWYQDKKYYAAYYAKTRLGKTFSNAVPFSIANYHDLEAVMKDKAHHMYIDHPGVQRPSKVYLNEAAHKNDDYTQLDQLANLYKLSHGETLEGHAGLDSHVANCANLEFILQSDIAQSGTWTSIGSSTTGDCFSGNVYGDGYTISGLDKSLFGSLCGNVYNLGVTGTASFTGSGIADGGSGLVENCWFRLPDGSSVSGSPKAIFGGDGTLHNSYYDAAQGFAARTGAVAKPAKAFYNGEVAYNLNRFYLHERYLRSQESPSTTAIGSWTYVNNRYSDGDFIYAEGKIPTEDNIRKKTNGDAVYYEPLWPDDYLFFGQTLTYGHVARAHQDNPAHLLKAETTYRLLTTDNSNRVYRAPAYFRNSTKSVAHFNPAAVFAAKSKDGTKEVYPGMTAIDFSGFNDATYAEETSGGIFYPRALDDAGLNSFNNVDLTRNLLVYVPQSSVNNKTFGVLQVALPDINYQEVDSHSSVIVAPVNESAANGIMGHAVYHQGGDDYLALNDHFLVDKQEFWCPKEYSFDDNMCMWHQRKPDGTTDLYVNSSSAGWQGISLPFTVTLLTTQQKGELTHFYDTSTLSGTNPERIGSTGHEYWLREFVDMKTENNETVAVFNKPAALTSAGNVPADSPNGEDKHYFNTFLWDYYYENGDMNQKDKNTDEYQQYYNENHQYDGYPYQLRAIPYIIGLPGNRYYEFDLSGTFWPENTASPRPDRLDPQVITFVSAVGATIPDSNEDMTGVKNGSYTFMPNYLTTVLTASDYALKADGSGYVKPAAETTVLPFRPYFTSASGAPSFSFSEETSSLRGQEGEPDIDDELAGTLDITTRRKMIVVTSQLRHATDIRIFGVNGQTIDAYSIQPGQTVETPVGSSGIYIVRDTTGRYIKKISVK